MTTIEERYRKIHRRLRSVGAVPYWVHNCLGPWRLTWTK